MSMGFFDTIASDDVTLHGLEKWTCYLYEKLGWMTLAYESGSQDKVSSYLISIKKLKLSIESRLKIITSEDAKIDLTTILLKVKHLYKIATKLFDKQYIKKTICNKCALPLDREHDDDSIESKDIKQKLIGGAKSNKSIKSIKSIKSTKSINPSKSAPTTLKVLKVSKGFNLENLKKLSKKSSKKTSKVQSKKSSKKTQKIKDEPLIKKLSKIPSKKTSKKSSKKNASIFKKI